MSVRTRAVHRAIGHRFTWTTSDPALDAWLTEVLQPLAEPRGAREGRGDVLEYRWEPVGDEVRVLAGEQELVRGVDGRPLAGNLLWHLNLSAVRSAAPSRVVVHAAAAARDGRVVLLAAPMESGKTTTVAGLLRAGFRYLTDEAVALDPATLVAEPYWKPLSVDRGSWPVLPELAPAGLSPLRDQWAVPLPPDLRAGPGPVGLLLFPQYAPDRPTALVPLAPGEAAELLAVSSFTLDGAPDRDLTVFARLAAGTPAYRLHVRDLDEAVGLVDTLFDRLG